MDWLQSQDEKLLILINSADTPFGDVVMQLASNRLFWIPAYLLLAYLLFRYNGLRYLVLSLVVVTLVVIASDQISSGLLKPMVARPRPCHLPELRIYLHLIQGKCGGAFGFVSSHAANFFAVATFLSWHFKNRFPLLPILLFGVAGFVSLSRIYLGVHYPGDVIGGILVGLVSGYFGVLMFKFLRGKLNYEGSKENTVVDIK